MNTAVLDVRTPRPLADAALRSAARLWLVVAVAGQWFFVAYIAMFYGSAAIDGAPERWNRVLAQGWQPEHTLSNAALSAHLLLAALITLSGALQLVPALRTRFRAIHRWNGRAYVVTAVIMAVSGIYLLLTGDKVVGDVAQHAAILGNGVLIVVAAALTWRRALARDLAAHRRWALRLFMLVNGVWFFRVGLMFWLFVNGGPVGFDPRTFTGPALTTISFAQVLVPLAVLELCFRVRGDGSGATLATAALVFALTGMMALGEFAAIMGLWLPHM